MNVSITVEKARPGLALVVLVLSATLSPSQSIAQNCWLERVQPAPGLPPFRSDDVAMAYDSLRQVVVLLEWDRRAELMRTLEWDGKVWRDKTNGTGPSAFRRDFRIAFDAARGVTVLFGGGGSSGQGAFGDTWTWNGTNWNQASNGGPSARDSHAMAYDAQRGVIVLFGGEGGVLRGDTWEWNGSAWTMKSTSGPTARHRSAMAYDETRGEVILFGGIGAGGTYFGDTWKWNGASWTQRASTGPTGRIDHAMAYDHNSATILMYGGKSGNGRPSGEIWSWNGVLWSQMATSDPNGRIDHAMASDASRSRVVMFGGSVGSSLTVTGDTWEWDGSQWIVMPRTPAYQTILPGLAYDSVRKVTVLHGGKGAGPSIPGWTISRDTCEWDGTQWQLRSWGLNPSSDSYRWHFPLAFRLLEPTIGIMMGVGGESSSGPLGGSIWRNGEGFSSITSGPPNANISGHSMVTDSARGEFVVFQVQDTFESAGPNWEHVSAVGPSSRVEQGMAFDSHRNVTVLFGGVSTASGQTLLGDTWEWDGSNWSLRATSGPTPRKFHAMAFDEDWRRTILFGGEDADGLCGDTWTWDGTTWEELAISGPSPRNSHRMAYDSDRGHTVLFGGHDFADTWEFTSSCPFGFNNRFLSISPKGINIEAAAIRVTLLSLHHPDPPNSGGVAPDFSAMEGQVRWAGPSFQETESSSEGVIIDASILQCTPHYQYWSLEWSPVDMLQLTGSAIVPSSTYKVEWLSLNCMGAEEGCAEILRTEYVNTARWGDVVPPFNPQSQSAQPDFGDIAGLVNKFRSSPGAPLKARALLAGTDAFGNIDISPDLGFSHIAACVDAFRGAPYPYAIQACP